MSLRRTFLTILLILQAMLIAACKTSEPLAPVTEKPEENPPGARDYEWTVDTLYTPDTDLYRFWGTSPSDLWVGGFGIDVSNNLWHYDGIKWEKSNIKDYGSIRVRSIFGFSSTDIWLSGESGKIWHGDGKSWTESMQFSSEGYRFISLSSIWGEAPDNIYAVGVYDSLVNNTDNLHALIFHFNGKSWERINLVPNTYELHFIYKEKESKNYYLYSTITNYKDMTDTIKCLEFDGIKLKEIASQLYVNDKNLSMAKINGKIYYFINSDMCRYINGKMEVIKTIEGINRGYVLGGRNENDLFFNLPGAIYQYNGSDLMFICTIPNILRVYDMAIFEKEVFILANLTLNKSYIIKGKLK